MLVNGKPITPPVWKYPGVEAFQRKLCRKLKALEIASRILNRLPLKWSKQKNRRISAIQNALEGLQYYIRIYGPYTRLNFEFETTKIQQLSNSLSTCDQNQFNIDISRIDWQEYLQSIHIPGIKRFVLKLEPNPSTKLRKEIKQMDLAHRSAPQNKGQAEKPYQTILDLVRNQAESLSDKTALQIERNGEWIRYSYRQLYDISRQVAFSLWERGFRKDDKAILISENQPEWGISYLAAIQIGIIVVPIDPQSARNELLALAKNTQAKAILMSEILFEKLNPIQYEGEPMALLNINDFCLPFETGQIVNRIETIPHDFPSVKIHPDSTASIIFTMGTTVDPRGAMLSHKGFLANILAVADALPPNTTDQFLSILPLYHALGFSCSFLMSIYGGGTVTYVNTFKPTTILETMRKTQTTVLIGVPRLYKLLYDAIDRYVVQSPIEPDKTVDRAVIEQVEETLGGHIRVLVSGGAALPNEVYEGFEQFGFTIYQGYGMTETAPVLSVNPAGRSKIGSVGPGVNGVQLQILNPDNNGVGEIVTKSPSMMEGYYENPKATQEVVREGLLYTGDLGYIDEEGYLYITGRTKDVIVSSTGKNIYPVELEELYRHSSSISEICVVGIDTPDSFGEEVYTVIVPNYKSGSKHSQVQQEIQEHLHTCAHDLPTYQYLQKVYFWESELPKFPNCTIDRTCVKKLLLKQLLDEMPGPVVHNESTQTAESFGEWSPDGREIEIVREIGRLTRTPIQRIRKDSTLDTELGLDSLMRFELLLLLESRLSEPIAEEVIAGMQTVGDVVEAVKLTSSQIMSSTENAPRVSPNTIEQPRFDSHPNHLANVISFGIRTIYNCYFSIQVEGLHHVPNEQSYIIAANHTSHLDTPAIISALGKTSRKLHPLSATDYFYNSRFKAWFFSRCLNTLPFDREDNSTQSLRIAKEVLLQGENLLVFPEGTRSISGDLQPFKPGLGLLAYETSASIIPTYIAGTFKALPKGKRFPRKISISVVFGAPIIPDSRQDPTADKMSHEIYRDITNDVRTRIENLRDSVDN